MGLCEQCGLCYTENDIRYCFSSKEPISGQDRKECANYIKTQYDGGEQCTPEEHLFLLQNQIESRKMKKMEGLHFRN